MKINNSNDLNTYYSDTVKNEGKVDKSDKTRLIVVKDETGEHLETKKLNIFERIGAAFFDGKASLGRVVEFCTKNQIHSGGLFESVKKYNSEHKEKPISYSYMLVGEKKEGKSLKTDDKFKDTDADFLMRMENLTSAVEYASSKNKSVPLRDKSVPLRELLTPDFVKQPQAQAKLEQYLQEALNGGKEIVAVSIINHLDADHLKRLVDNACGSGDVKLVSASLERRIDELEMNNTQGGL